MMARDLGIARMCARTQCLGRVLIDRQRGIWDCRYVRMSRGTTPAGWSSADVESVLTHAKQQGLQLQKTRAPDSRLSPAVVLSMLRENALTFALSHSTFDAASQTAFATLQTRNVHAARLHAARVVPDGPRIVIHLLRLDDPCAVEPHRWEASSWIISRPRSNGRGDQPQRSATVKPHFWLSIDPHEPSKTHLERFWAKLREKLSSATLTDKRCADPLFSFVFSH